MICSKRSLLIVNTVQFAVIVVLVVVLINHYTWTQSDYLDDNQSEYNFKALDSRILETSQNKSVLLLSTSKRKRIFLLRLPFSLASRLISIGKEGA